MFSSFAYVLGPTVCVVGAWYYYYCRWKSARSDAGYILFFCFFSYLEIGNFVRFYENRRCAFAFNVIGRDRFDDKECVALLALLWHLPW